MYLEIYSELLPQQLLTMAETPAMQPRHAVSTSTI